MVYNRKDKYYQKAKTEGKASRAFYKLEEIQQKFKLIKPGDAIVDLGCAPGGWLQSLAKLVGKSGTIVGVDFEPLTIEVLPPIIFIKEDVMSEALAGQIKNKLGRVADLVVSDLAPHTTGVKFRDSFLSYELVSRAFEIAQDVLKVGGSFVAKIFPGVDQQELQNILKKYFRSVKQFVPSSTRKTSNEFYIVATGFNGSSERIVKSEE